MTRKQSNDDAEFCLRYGIHIPSKTILVSGEIDAGCKNTVLLAKNILDSSAGTVTVNLDTQGGDLYEALSIYDCLKSFKSRVEIVGWGKVMSMGTLILQAASQGGRFLMPNCTVMLHQGHSDAPMDHPDAIQRYAQEDKRLRARINHIMYSAMKIKKKEYIETYNFDVYMPALMAVAKGLADKVLEHSS